MSTVTWLHISDLHWRESHSYDANVVAKALLNDLTERTEIAPELAHIDFVFVTGDIAFASQPEQYRLAERFFDDLRRTTGVRKNRIFIVPGNHDVDRSVISDEARDMLDRLGNRQAVNRLLGYDVDRAKIMYRFHRYQHFVNDYWRSHLPFDNVRYSYIKRRKVKNGGDSHIWVEILGLNSAWASASDDDRHNLFLGERQVRSALDQTRRASIRIALMHHPFEWLRDFDRDDCEALLLDKCDFILQGHLHRTGAMRLESPQGNAMVFTAGACYDGRDYPNTYNLVALDLDSGRGTIYLRIYSDQQGGFWTQDSTTYRGVSGEYTFSLPRSRVTDASIEPSVDEIVAELREKDVGEISLPPPKAPVSGHYKAGLAKWWRERGYTSNPFAYHNAADLDGNALPQLFPFWYIDPNMPANWQGLGQTPTLDEVESLETNELVLIYTPSGGGKTFYRRWAAKQIEFESSQCAIEVSNLAGQIYDPETVTARELAACVYRHICEKCSVQVPPAPADHAVQILQQCDGVLERLSPDRQVRRRAYVLIDDLDQLFDEYEVEQNRRALVAITELCKAAADRSGGEPLALRMFIPLELKEPVQRVLGVRRRQRIREYTIRWSAEHCQAIVERRLDSYWEQGPDTGVVHINRLLAPDAIHEFRRWLERQQGISPRCVIRVFDELGRYAHRRGITAGIAVDVEYWNTFLEQGQPEFLCASAPYYPLVGQNLANGIEELEHRQIQFLLHLYESVREQRLAITNMWELGEELGFSKEETHQIVDHLAADHLLQPITFGGGISITDTGVATVQDSYVELKELIQQASAKKQMVRVPKEIRVTQDSQEGTSVRILFLAANPADTDRLRLGAEIREIDQALRQSDFRDRFDVRQHWAVRTSDVQELFLRHQPDIVHFSGHGSASSEIVLEDQAGKLQPVPIRTLKSLFSVLKDNIRCVVLNACYSELQAEAIAEHIDCVVGMSRTIEDAAAISFSAAFYRALGYARDVQTAFDLGCMQIDLEGLDDQDIPRLLAKRVSPTEIVFACDE